MRRVRGRLIAAALFVAALASGQENPVEWSLARTAVSVEKKAASGKKAAKTVIAITVSAKIEAGWHLYSISQPPGGPIATRIWLPEEQAFKQAGDLRGPEPLKNFESSFNMDVEFYEGSAEFQVTITPKPSGKQTLRVNAYYQSCNDKLCLPPKTVKLELPLEEQ